MSFQNKRGALEQITRDDYERDGGREEEPVEEARVADAATMSKRKVLPLPKRRGGGSSAGTPNKPASNGFSGLSGFGSANSTSTSSTGSPFSGLSSAANTTTTTSSNNASETSDEATLKRIAMNEKFAETVASKVRENASVDLSEVVKKYLEYAKTLGGASSTTTAPIAPVSSAPASTSSTDKPKSSLFSFGAAKNFSASSNESTSEPKSSPALSFGNTASKPAPKPFSFGGSNDTKDAEETKETKAPSFGFGKKEETKESTSTTPKPFTFGSTPSGPSFSFSKSGADVAKEKAESGAPSFSFTAKKPEEKKEEDKKEDKKVVEVEDSDSDSDEEIDITKGPSFTLAAPPTTTNSAFSFNKPQTEVKSTGPSFTFDKKVSTGSFTFKPEPKKDEDKKEDKEETAKKDFTWNPSQGVVFGSNSKTEDKSEKDDSASKPAFSFGGAKAAESSDAKPFSFGAKPASDDKPKPFTFGSKPAESADKPKPFSFGASSTASSDKPAFSFGATPAFGSKPAESSDKPAFGVSSGNLFKAGESKTEAKPASDDSGEPSDTVKTVTDSDDFSGQGPGEENEDNVAEYRTKLYKLDDGKWDVCGVGQLRVLVDKDTKKARLLMRAEQSGRVLLNCVVRKELTYSTTKSNVNIVDFDADSKPIKYMARIKTVPEAEQLSAKIEEVK